MNQDPFSQVYSALWDMALAHPVVQAAVKSGNRVRFDHAQARDPFKQSVADADLPEIVLYPEGLTGNVLATSSTTQLNRTYRFATSSGDQRYTLRLADVEWALVEALCGWPEKLASLEWRGRRYVKRVQFVGGSAGLSDPERNRGIVGWSSLINVEVEMHFVTAHLREALGEQGA